MYIIVPSYPSIYFAIYQFTLDNDPTVITNNSSVRDILDNLGIKHIYIKLNFKNIIQSRINLDKLINSLDLNRNLYLLDNIHTIEGFYLVEKWTVGNVYYKNLSTDFNLFKAKLTFKEIVKERLLNFFLGLNLIYRNQNNKPAIGIDNAFLKRKKVNYLDIGNYDLIKLKVINQIKINIKYYNSILILQGKLEGIVETNSLLKVYIEISKLESLVIKEHPKHTFSNNLFDTFPKVPMFYPVEMCYGNIGCNIISVYSLSLIIASKLKNKKAISLLEIVDWYNADYKIYMKNMLIKNSGNKILFPKSIVELKKILFKDLDKTKGL